MIKKTALLSFITMFVCFQMKVNAQSFSPHSSGIIATINPGRQHLPSVAMAPNDVYMVIWKDLPSKDIKYRNRYEASWRNAERPLTDGSTAGLALNEYDILYPEIKADGTGNFVVTYTIRYSDNSGDLVYFKRFSFSGAALSIDSPVLGDYYGSSVAVHENGSFLLAYGKYRGSQIYAQAYDNSGRIQGDQVAINSVDDNIGRSEPKIATSENGNFAVIWKQDDLDGTGQNIYFRLFDSQGNALNQDTRVNTTVAGSQNKAKISMAPDGNFVVIWEGDDDSGRGIFGQRYDVQGQAVGDEFRVNTALQDDQFDPDLTHDHYGNLIVFWASEPTPNDAQSIDTPSLRAKIYDPNGVELLNEEYVIRSTPQNGIPNTNFLSPSVTVNTSGQAAVAWYLEGNMDIETVRLQVYYPPSDIMLLNNIINENEAGGVVGFLSDVNDPDGSFYTYSIIDDQGQEGNPFFEVVGNQLRTRQGLDYEQQRTHTVRIRATDYLGNTYEELLTVNVRDKAELIPTNRVPINGDFGNKEFPNVAMAPDGSFVAIWEAGDQNDFGIYGQRFDLLGNRIGQRFLINTTQEGIQQRPDISMGPDGRFIVVWESSHNGWQILGQRFNADATPLGNEMLIGPFVGAVPARAPKVDVGSNGSYVVVWQRNEPANLNAEEILASRFASFDNVGGAMFQVNSYRPGSQSQPDVAVGSDGRFIIVWRGEGNETVTGIYGKNYNSAGAVVREYAVNNTNGSLQPAVEMRRDGRSIITWLTHDNLNGIYTRRVETTGSLSGAIQRVSPEGVLGSSPKVSIDGDGNHIITYSRSGVFYQAYDVNSVVSGGIQQVDGNITASNANTSAIDGRFVVVWQDADRNIYARLFIENISPTRITLDNNSIAENQEENSLIGTLQTMDADANDRHTYELIEGQGDTHNNWFHLEDNQVFSNQAFDYEEQSTYTIRVRSTDLFGAWTEQQFEIQILDVEEGIGPVEDEFQVNQTLLNRQSNAKVGMDRDGNFVVVWQNRVQPNPGVNSHIHEPYWRSFDSQGIPLQDESPLMLNEVEANHEHFALDMAMNDNGDFVATWVFPLEMDGVYTRKFNKQNGSYDPEAAGIGIAIRANDVFYPSVDLNNNGDYVVAWEDRLSEINNDPLISRVRLVKMSNNNTVGPIINVETNYGSQMRPDIALDDLGNFAVVWVGDDDINGADREHVLMRLYNFNGDPISNEIEVEQTSGPFISNINSLIDPSIAIAENGNIIVSWLLKLDGHGIKTRIFNSLGEPITGEIQVNQYPTDNQKNPDISCYGDFFAITWESSSQDGSYSGVYARYFNLDGTPRGNEFQINRYTKGSQQNPSIALQPSAEAEGSGIVVWQSGIDSNDIGIVEMQDGSNFGIFGRRISPGESLFNVEALHEPEVVNIFTDGQQKYAAIGAAQDGDGSFSITWEGANEENPQGIHLRNYSDGAPAVQESLISGDLETVYSQIATNRSGRKVIVWHEKSTNFRPEGTEIKAHVIDENGISLANNITVNTFAPLDQFLPRVGMDDAGNFVIAWHGWGSKTENGVYMRRYDPMGNPLSDPVLVNDDPRLGKSYADIAVQANGNFMIVWQSPGQHNGRTGTYAKIYDAAGEVIRPEFRLNANADFHNYFPNVTPLSDGTYIATWEQFENGSIIIGRKFQENGDVVGQAFQVNEAAQRNQLRPQVTADHEGNFMISWTVWEQNKYQVYARFFDKGRIPTSEPIKINTPAFYHQFAPSVSAWGDRNFVLTWTGSDDNRSYGILLRRFGIPQIGAEINPAISELKLSESNNIMVYPNPTSHDLNLRMSASQEILHIGLYNLMGEKISCKYTLQNNSAYLETHPLPSGLYVVAVTDKQQQTKRIKWIKK